MSGPLSLDDLNRLTPAQFVAALGGIFEHSPWVAEAVTDRRPFATLASLHEAMKGAVRSASEARKLALLREHPDLAGKAALAGMMTTDSKSEQGSAGLDRLSLNELERFNKLNSAYNKKFGFPFIICVRRHTKDSIFKQFELRLQNEISGEYDASLTEIFRITALRLDQLVNANDRLDVCGYMDIHVIDLEDGVPAAGLEVELRELSASGPEQVLGLRSINAQGVTGAPFFEERPIPIGRYELSFAVGDYFATRKQNANLVLFDVVPIRFAVAEPEGRYHIPLRITPWAYTVYRGQ